MSCTSGHILALRHRDQPGARGLFAKLIRLRLVTAYPHAGVVAGATLFHSTLADGAQPQKAPTSASDWLVTHRLRGYMRELPPEHWRRRWADYLCHHLLDPLSIAQAWLDKHLSSTAAAPPIDRLATLRHPKDALP